MEKKYFIPNNLGAEVAKTDQVTFANGTAEFNQTISLSVNMYYD
jgi:hypothetical protein